MKVVVWHNLPFSLAHGGFETLTHHVMEGLRELGVEVEPEKWWETNQTGDILQCFGRPTDTYIELAKAKGYRVSMLDVLDNTASRSSSALWSQKQLTKMVRGLLPGFTNRMGWKAYEKADALQFILPRERDIAQYLFGAPLHRMHVIPHGLSQGTITELNRPAERSEDYLISAATIDGRKNTVLLAQAAKLAKVPVVFIGKPYSENDPYFKRFLSEVDGCYVRYDGFVSENDKYRLFRHARGFTLLSHYESGCIAVYEAAAAGLPMLLSNTPWATTSYPVTRDIVFTNIETPDVVARELTDFHARARRKPDPIFPVMNWRDVAGQYLAIYESILSGKQT